jgi:S1-C subfamily serine protease
MSDSKPSLSSQLAATVEQAAASVVRVTARTPVPSSGVIWSNDGLIVTASHAVVREEEIQVSLPGEREAAATLVGRDGGTDVAVLRVDARDFPPPSWSDLDGVRVGQLALAVARPGRTARAALGIVSVLGGSWRTSDGGRVDRYLETDARLGPGFSGGLLVGDGGRALGMVTSGLGRRVALAIPASTLKRVADSIVKSGRVRRGYLGVGLFPVRLTPPLQRETRRERGLIVVSVQPGSPAERSGIQLGDVFVEVNGEPIDQIDGFRSQLDEESIDREVTARIARAGGVRDLTIQVGAKP